MHQSLWEEISFSNEKIKSFSKKTDILIIGGGITGLSTAYFLKDSKKKITVIDKGKMMTGITAKTTAKITFLQGTYKKIEKERDRKVSESYYTSQKEAISLLKNIIETNHIACDLEEVPSILFTIEKKNVEKVKQEEDLLKSFGEQPKEITHPKIAYGFSLRNTYTFHPLKYLIGLIKTFPSKVNLVENVLAFQIKKTNGGYQVFTSQGIIDAKFVVVACHYPFFILPSLIPFKTYMKREYVNVGRKNNKETFTALNMDKELHSIRFYKDLILYGSNQHLLTDLGKKENAFLKSREDFQTFFQQEPLFTWLNQDIYSYDHLPLIGKVRKNDSHLFLATAYGAFGMTNATLAGKIIADLIEKGTSPYETLFDPTRTSFSYSVRSIIGSSAYLKSYLRPLFVKKSVSQVHLNGEIYNLYVDEHGEKHLILNKCPHFKCPLLLNEEDKTWDCPCHGSRFDLDGNLLFGPSKQFNGKISDQNEYKKRRTSHTKIGRNIMNQQYEKVPNMISGKDLDYLSDMFEWNYMAYKQAMDAKNQVEDSEILSLLSKASDTFHNHLELILNELAEGGCYES